MADERVHPSLVLKSACTAAAVDIAGMASRLRTVKPSRKADIRKIADEIISTATALKGATNG